jgi:uncharacterized DUF497 family protein
MVNWSKLEIVWDEWNENHILKHGIKKNEVENALKGDIYVKREKEVYLVIGESFGRFIFIVLAEREGNKVYPITVREADEKMKKLYKRKVKIVV